MKIAIVSLILITSLTLAPQDGITLVGSSTNKVEIAVDEKIEKSEFIFTNNTDRTINLLWERKSNTLVKGWDYSVCAYGRCSVGVPESGVFKSLKPNESGFFALHLFPKGIIGNGKLEIEVFDEKFPEMKQLLIFDVTVVE